MHLHSTCYMNAICAYISITYYVLVLTLLLFRKFPSQIICIHICIMHTYIVIVNHRCLFTDTSEFNLLTGCRFKFVLLKNVSVATIIANNEEKPKPI